MDLATAQTKQHRWWEKPLGEPLQVCAVHNGKGRHCPGKVTARRVIDGVPYSLCAACAKNVDQGAYGPVDGQTLPSNARTKVFA